MNRVILCGRLTRDAEVRWSQGEDQRAVARYTLAVDRPVRQGTDKTADFISCVSFGRTAEFVEKFGKKGTKFIVEGRIQTGSYTNKDGQKVYTTDVIVDHMEFAESKKTDTPAGNNAASTDADGFMSIPDGIEEELPFV